jgi:AcrR family transcriptional regulator
MAFWEHGYETSSIVDLTTAMGITARSLYTAFGDNKQLFLAVVALYAGDPTELSKAMNRAPSARKAVSQMLNSVAEAFTANDMPKGCLLASATASGSSASADVQRAVANIRLRVMNDVATRIERDVRRVSFRQKPTRPLWRAWSSP